MLSVSYLKLVWRYAVTCLLLAILLTACGLGDPNQSFPEVEGRTVIHEGDRSTLFGPGGMNIFGDGKLESSGGDGGGGGIGINSFLWRASLDTLSFMPLSSADPFGGVIITDWYSTPANPEERFKMTVYILDRRLRADGIKVAVFKQTKNDATDWLSTDVGGDTAIQLENAILVRARQLRTDTLQE